jgi:hypothetical protein
MPKKSSYFPLALSRIIPLVVKPALKKHGFAKAGIITDWEDIVGSELASYMVPHKLVSKKEASESALHVHVMSGAALIIQHQHIEILDRINNYFGYRAVGKLKFIQTPILSPEISTPPNISPTLSIKEKAQIEHFTKDLQHKNLAKALTNFGQAIYRQTKTKKCQSKP